MGVEKAPITETRCANLTQASDHFNNLLGRLGTSAAYSSNSWVRKNSYGLVALEVITLRFCFLHYAECGM
jgi:hypothetical protein